MVHPRQLWCTQKLAEVHHDQHGRGAGGLEGVNHEVGAGAGGHKMSMTIGEGDGEAVGEGKGVGEVAGDGEASTNTPAELAGTIVSRCASLLLHGPLPVCVDEKPRASLRSRIK